MSKNRILGAILCALCVALCFSAPQAVAQETTAGIQGIVKDQSGAAVANAMVELSSSALIGTKKLETDQAGAYHFTNLPPGGYNLAVTKTGFRTYKYAGIILEVGRLPTVDITLDLGEVTEIVEVSGMGPIVDVTQSKVATTVSEDNLKNIPKGRSFQSVIPFAPGARQEPLQSRGRGGNGFQIDGASDSENTYLVEGMDTTNIQDGGVGKNVPMEFIQEVQIKTSGFEAEFGGALGGVVNVVQKRGSNNWHGSVLTKYSTDTLNANDQCSWFALCGLRSNPAEAFNAAKRQDASAEQYLSKKDHQRTIDPGGSIGGPIFKDRLWIFASYVPSFDRLRRTVNFTGALNPGTRTFNRSIDTHDALTRLDWLPTSKIRVYGTWQYGYERRNGIDLPNPDSVLGQRNTDSGSDPTSFRPERGQTVPSSVYNFGSDITVSSKLVFTVRYGYWFNNLHDFGTPNGIRYLYAAGAVGAVGLDDRTPIPPQFQQRAGFQNIASNQKTFFDVYKRKSFSVDTSYYRSFFGSHSFKVGYSFNQLSNDVLRAFDGSLVRLNYGEFYDPLDPSACDVAGKPPCHGNWGYYIIRDGVDVQGKVGSYNHALYFQDAWTMGKGVTLNLGVRLDKESLPPYLPGAPAINFGWNQKVAPRLGGAWDVLRNGKLKVYGSFGLFYDIMKYSLPRGSFGGEYWHDCAYTLDNPDYTKIMPALVSNHSCPGAGGASGSLTGRFIENVNYRSVVINPQDPGVDPNIRPMRQHEYVLGSDYALSRNIGLELRYSRKRLDDTIEDVGVAVPGNELYYIGNPGKGIVANLLQRVTIDSSNVPVLPPTSYPPQCADCPLSPKAYRNYDGFEARLTKRSSGSWFGSISYTYSRLYGNYAGLTSSEVSDGSGGRHSPNNSRYFDLPNMAWTAYGRPEFGPLATDRPHTLKIFGWYRLKWFGQETSFGLDQLAYAGTPISTCWGEVSTPSSCSFVEERSNFVNLTEVPGADIQRTGITKNFRAPFFTQTDFSFVHELKVSKTNEAMRLAFEANVTNVLNQHAILSYYNIPMAGGRTTITPRIGGKNTGPTDWHALTDKGFDYLATTNLFKRTLDNRYGRPSLFQPSRTIRFMIRFSF